jgi:hypothetical protein
MDILLTVAPDPDIPGQHQPTGHHLAPARRREKNQDMAQAQEPA